MKQTLKNILGIGLIVVFFYVLSSLLNFAQAAGVVFSSTPDATKPLELDKKPQYNTQGMVEQQIPVFCGDSTFILSTSAKQMEESQILVGEVREGGAPYGKVIGILSFGHSVERDSGTFFMTLPGIGPEGQSMTCILGYGMNWTFFDDEGNLILPQDSL